VTCRAKIDSPLLSLLLPSISTLSLSLHNTENKTNGGNSIFETLTKDPQIQNPAALSNPFSSFSQHESYLQSMQRIAFPLSPQSDSDSAASRIVWRPDGAERALPHAVRFWNAV